MAALLMGPLDPASWATRPRTTQDPHPCEKGPAGLMGLPPLFWGKRVSSGGDDRSPARAASAAGDRLPHRLGSRAQTPTPPGRGLRAEGTHSPAPTQAAVILGQARPEARRPPRPWRCASSKGPSLGGEEPHLLCLQPEAAPQDSDEAPEPQVLRSQHGTPTPPQEACRATHRPAHPVPLRTPASL